MSQFHKTQGVSAPRPRKAAFVHPKKIRFEKNTREIEQMRSEGYVVYPLTKYHYRINGILDLFPTGGKWHDLRDNSWGSADSLAEFARWALGQFVEPRTLQSIDSDLDAAIARDRD